MGSSSSSDEDTSDEAMLARHEHTLQSMRDRWTLIQQLRREIYCQEGDDHEDTEMRRRMMMPYPHLTSRGISGRGGGRGGYAHAHHSAGGGSYGYYGSETETAGATGSSSFSAHPSLIADRFHHPYRRAPTSLPEDTAVDIVSPRRRTLFPLPGSFRRRGRPPKFCRNSHRNNTNDRGVVVGATLTTAAEATTASAAISSIGIANNVADDVRHGDDDDDEAEEDQ